MSMPSLFRVIGACAVWLGAGSAAIAADWQWVVDMPGFIANDTKNPPHVFLWIPPECKQVRGVVVGQHNMEEEGILEHPAFRRVMAEIGFATVWVTPGVGWAFNPDKAGASFDGMFRALAEKSGYHELADAPVVPIGHSAYASFPWHFAVWKPERTLAGVSVSGQWAWYKGREDEKEPVTWNAKALDGIPQLVTYGEYEWAEERLDHGLALRAKFPNWILTTVGEAGAGHFDYSDRKVAYLADYIRSAAKHRLPPRSPLSGPVPLVPVNPSTQGWLYERSHMGARATVAPAPVGAYTGDVSRAMWAFDEESAKAASSFSDEDKGKRIQLVGYRQKGGITPQTGGHQQVTLAFEPIEDGLTFKLSGGFLDTVPQGRPEKWVGKPKDSPIEHGNDPQNIRISRIAGPVQQIGPDTFAIRFNRVGFENAYRCSEIWMLASHPGDATYRRSAQQSLMRISPKLKDGADQTITFPAIADQKIGVKTVALKATSSRAESKVHYYVLAGPAEVVDDDHLAITAIPPRATLPITVTVVAWQWGRTIDPKVKSAEPVTRTFTIGK